MNFPFICSNIRAAPEYGVYISQLIRYPKACGFYQDFLNRIAANKEANEQRVPNSQVEIMTSNVLVTTMTWLTIMEYLCLN